MKSIPSLILVLSLTFSCASPSVESLPDLRSPSVIGYWYIDQPMHALYEATVYRFRSDGQVTAGAAFPEDYRTGTVGTKDLSVSCEFDGAWSSDGGQWLEIGLSCSDGHAREALLYFETGIASCTGDHGCYPLVHSVDGDTGNWTRNWPEWMWVRCIDEADCLTRLHQWTGA
jgi:hypothetical protein